MAFTGVVAKTGKTGTLMKIVTFERQSPKSIFLLDSFRLIFDTIGRFYI